MSGARCRPHQWLALVLIVLMGLSAALDTTGAAAGNELPPPLDGNPDTTAAENQGAAEPNAAADADAAVDAAAASNAMPAAAAADAAAAAAELVAAVGAEPAKPQAVEAKPALLPATAAAGAVGATATVVLVDLPHRHQRGPRVDRCFHGPLRKRDGGGWQRGRGEARPLLAHPGV